MKMESTRRLSDEWLSELQRNAQKKKSSFLILRRYRTKEIGQVINPPKIFSYILFLY
jgi:hypothetical protein